MAVRRRTLTETDKAEWANYVSRVAPLPGRSSVPAEVPLPLAEPIPYGERRHGPPPEPRSVRRVPPPPVAVGDQPGGIDSATWQRFRTGKLLAVRRLDLHGQTTQRAYFALKAFLRTAHADHVRCVEVITGRGSGETGGAIRREFPLWLNLPDIRPLVLAAAHPHAANSGSVRLLLRRAR